MASFRSKPPTDLHARISWRPGLPDLSGGRFGRLFPDMPCHPADGETLLRHGAAGGAMEDCAGADDTGQDNPRIPAGWPFLGQLIAHDITHDRAALQDHEDLRDIQNHRTPRLNLECVYGAGPVGQPYLYDRYDPDKFLIGASDAPTGDLPRNDQGLALIADSRNDTHLFLSQLHLGFLHFHNRTVDFLRAAGHPPESVFVEASRLVRLHYQHIVLHEFLPLTVGQDLMSELFESGPAICRYQKQPFIPVEFSGGAYRFGHAQVRSRYDVDANVKNVPLFPELVGAKHIGRGLQVDWKLLFQFHESPKPQASRKIRPLFVPALMRLPEDLVGKVDRQEFSSLASRDLYRGHALELPCGETVARTFRVEPCKPSQLREKNPRLQSQTPLLLYVLAEAESERNGEYLGAVGGRIVGEVLFGLLHSDPASILSQHGWQPTFGDAAGNFTIADLLSFAGVA